MSGRLFCACCDYKHGDVAVFHGIVMIPVIDTPCLIGYLALISNLLE
ncbi:hypothetical protein [Granulibacter bethesdensis]|nr:hypothetical protein [Granulibacter bethesdensis]ASW28586.1 hypothetical protein GbCGDNIH2_8188 [Granulibacter bethesdensis]